MLCNTICPQQVIQIETTNQENTIEMEHNKIVQDIFMIQTHTHTNAYNGGNEIKDI